MVSLAAEVHFSALELKQFSIQLLQKAGLPPEYAATVAATLVDGDLLGHDTHGLALLAPYVKEIEKGGITTSGAPEVVSGSSCGGSPPAGTVACASGHRCPDAART